MLCLLLPSNDQEHMIQIVSEGRLHNDHIDQHGGHSTVVVSMNVRTIVASCGGIKVA